MQASKQASKKSKQEEEAPQAAPVPEVKPPKHARNIIPPSVEQVTAYCAERKNSVDIPHWFSHYESNGWRVGKNPMKDWEAAVRTWEGGNFDAKPKKPVENLTPEQKARRDLVHSMFGGG